MRRRKFLVGIPAAACCMGKDAGGAAANRGSVTVQLLGSQHQRVHSEVNSLVQDLRQLDYEVSVGAEKEGPGTGYRVTVAVANRSAAAALRRGGWDGPRLTPEQYQLRAGSEAALVLGGDARGVLYAVSELRRIIRERRALPASLSLDRKPVFPVRRLSAPLSFCFGSPWDERMYIVQQIEFIRSQVLPRTAEFAVNSFEVFGRPGDSFDLDWVLGFEKYLELAKLFPVGERRARMALVEDLARTAHDNLLEFLVWTHELHLPPGFVDIYPQVKGVGYPICLSNEFLKRFVRDKYVEFFDAVPSADGVVLSVHESGQFSLITDAGCKCERCARMTRHERLLAVLNEVIAVCTERKKQVVLRTFQGAAIQDLHGHPELETIRKAYTGLPTNVQVMSKYCPMDFYGGEIADEPLIGAFPNRHLVEFSLDVEWQGRTFVPALTPKNFQRRVRYALGKKCAGIVARLCFPIPSEEPQWVLGHPNEFNAWYLSKLLWDADTDIDDSLAQWTKAKYGVRAAPFVARALRNSEDITQKTFFAQGETLINYHNMISSVSHADNNLWTHALSKWDPAKRSLSESLFRPTDQLIEQCKLEKRRAAALAVESLSNIQAARSFLPATEYEILRYFFEKLRDSAELWGQLTELYLLHRQIAFSPAKAELVQAAFSSGGQARLQRLLSVAGAALGKAVEMEQRHGKNSWPVFSPDRGVTAYQFVHETLRYYIAAVTGEPARDQITYRSVEAVVTSPVVAPGSVESLWRAIVEAGRPVFDYGVMTEATLQWPAGLRQIRFGGKDMLLTANGGRSLALPLPYPVGLLTLERAVPLRLRMRKTTHQLEVSA